MKISISESIILFEKVGLWQKFPDCFPLCLAVRYKIDNSDEMKNTLAALKKTDHGTINIVFVL
jgi:hypothetical protein